MLAFLSFQQKNKFRGKFVNEVYKIDFSQQQQQQIKKKPIILIKPRYSFKKRLNYRRSSEYKYINWDKTISFHFDLSNIQIM